MEEIQREQPLEEPANVSGETVSESAVSVNGSLTTMADGDFIDFESFEDKVDTPLTLQEQKEGDLGKFKSVQALFDAYNNLQASYTKKCQRLSELEKEKADSEEVVKKDETSLQDNLDLFLSKNAQAKGFAEEIKSRIESSGKTDLSTIEGVWNQIVLEHIKNPFEGGDYIVDKYVLENQNVRDKIIQDYINSLNKTLVPKVISSGQGQRVADVSSGTPASLFEAKKMMERMFE